MEVLQRPIHRDESGSKIVEERLISRVCTLDSKITGCCDKTRSKVSLPETIGNDASGQGISGIDDPLCQLQSATGMCRDNRALHEVLCKRGNSPRDGLLLDIVGVSTDMHWFVTDSLCIHYGKHARERRMEGTTLFNFGVDSRDRLGDIEALKVSNSRRPGLGNELKLREDLFAEPPLLGCFVHPLTAVWRRPDKA